MTALRSRASRSSESRPSVRLARAGIVRITGDDASNWSMRTAVGVNAVRTLFRVRAFGRDEEGSVVRHAA